MHLKLYLFFISCFFSITLTAQFNNLKFENLDTADGLSSSTCLEIFQDKAGYLWFGTIDGLNKYNGYDVEVFRPIFNDSTSISNIRVNSITEDNNGNLWVGTNNGLNVLNKNNNKFTRINIYQKELSKSTSNDVINKLLFDSEKNTLWVATNNGVVKIIIDNDAIDFRNLAITYYINNPLSDNTLDNNNVNVILKDKNEAIWISTNGDYLNKYNAEKDNFDRVLIGNKTPYGLNYITKRFFIDSDGDFWIGNDLSNLILWNRKDDTFEHVSIVENKTPIYDIFEDKNGLIWVSTDGFGLFLFDKNTKKLQRHIENNQSDPFSLPNNQPSKIFQDTNGVFWIGSYDSGVSKLDLSKNSFGHYYYQPNNINGLNSKIVQSVLQDSKERIWLGVYNGGLNLFNEKKQSFKHFSHNPNNVNSLSSNKILYTFESSDGYIWVCTLDGGLNRFNPKTSKFKRFIHNKNNAFSIAENSVWSGVEDSEKRIWLGLKSNGLGLFNPEKELFYNYKNSFDQLNVLGSNFVFSLFIDSKNRLLIGTTLGLNYVNLDSLDKLYPTDIDFLEISDKLIKGHRINYITEDHLGNIWLCAEDGIHKLDSDLNLLRSYTSKNGLSNNLVLGIKEDNDNNLWIISKSGITSLNPKTHKIKNYNLVDGLQGAEFQSKSIEKISDGRIIAGGINGFNIFDPKVVSVQDSIVLTPKITSLRIYNRKVEFGDSINDRILLDKPIIETKNLELKHNENYISFGFEALFLNNPNQVKYAYKMHGIDNKFLNGGSNRSVNYSNLQPGEYTFEVKASIDEVYGNQNSATINIQILPPFWKTWWAYLIYVFTGVSLIWFFLKLYTKNIEDAQVHELDLMKIQFFVNVSHEFRTPLTLILNPLDKILANFNNSEVVKASALSGQRSARRLMHLVNQLLDYRKMDAGMSPLKLEKGNIVNFTEDIFLLFEGLASNKSISYNFKSKSKKITALFDFDKVEKIITNLLSNAIKFTDGGEITVSINKVKRPAINDSSRFKFFNKELHDYVEIIIADTGSGIGKEQLNHLFSRFLSFDTSNTGTGIGLNFTKVLVEVHKGQISVKSKEGEGTEFTVILPLKIKGKEEVVENVKNEFLLNSMKAAEYDMLISDESLNNKVNTTKTNSNKPTLLIVEDNRELRLHLKDDLQENYNVLEATNGELGLKKALKHYPDIIISDVMMPKLDGFEMCKALKSEIGTCHIPIILLTARSREEDLISGYNHGADGYLSKPFKVTVLKARIKNLLEAKERLKEKFSGLGAILPSSELTRNSLDEAFIEKSTKYIIKNISDSDFKIDNLVKEVGIGRSQFFRKIQDLTGHNPSGFIRTVRLKYASELLRNTDNSIKEIAYMTGFNSSTYFGKTFRELFEITPKEYVDKHRESK